MDKNRSEPLKASQTEGGGPQPTENETMENSFINVRISDVQKAIHERMCAYAGEGGKGIDGVWNAIDPCYKYPDDAKLEGIKDEYGSLRIKKDAFRRAVSRLKHDPVNENMNFGMRGNILLTLNILEILGLFNRGELFAIHPKRRNTRALIADSSNRVKSIEKKLDMLSVSLDMSLKRTPRFTAFKIAHDWEKILYRVNEIIHGRDDPDFYSNANNADIKSILRRIVSDSPNDSHFIYSIYNLLYDYEEYFYQDKILFGFFKMLNEIRANKLIHGYKLIISPLYILCFFLKMNKRFLIMINGADKKYNIESFKIEKISPYNAIDYDIYYEMGINESINNEKAIKLIGEDKPGIFLQKTNNAMYKATRQIIELLEENEQRISEILYEHNVSYAQEGISAFYEIYTSHAGLDEVKLKIFLDKNKSTSLKDLYSLIAIGRPNSFYLSNDSIDKLKRAKDRSTDYVDRLKRDFGSY
jgi:hypothetical protein